jgi:hypothetical protein
MPVLRPYLSMQAQVRGRVARALALCQLARGRAGQAARCVELADACEPRCAATAFLRLKLALLSDSSSNSSSNSTEGAAAASTAATAAGAALKQLAGCDGFCPDMLWVGVLNPLPTPAHSTHSAVEQN